MIDSAPMRRITQFVALIVALLLAGPSALAEAPCLQWLHSDSDHAPVCCIRADGGTGHKFSADCHESMRSESVAAECNQSGCQMATVNVVAQAFTTAKSRTDANTSFVVIAQLPVLPASGLVARSFESASAPGPAKYLRFQVFRI